jgi:peptidoglycan/LPS O-acetylase OafA/YrhL
MLRAVCAIWIVFDHALYWTTTAQGPDAIPAPIFTFFSKIFDPIWQPTNELHPAVLIFIALSGYCIHRAAFREHRVSVVPFAIRRAFRIIPVYIAGIALGVIGFWVTTSRSPELAPLTGTNAISVACVVVKLSTIAALLPFSTSCVSQGNSPLTTVMAEIVLYAAYACAFVYLVWNGREAVVWIICLFAMGLNLVVAIMASAEPQLYYWWQNDSFLGFLPYWWLGAAMLNPGIARVSHRRPTILLLLAAWVLLTIFLLHTANDAVVSELRKVVLALLIGALIVAFDRLSIVDNPLAAIGRAGYSVYAFHAPFVVMMCVFGVWWWANPIIAVMIGIAINAAYEEPLRKLGRRLGSTTSMRMGAHESNA